MRPNKPLFITGHSMGGALATIAAADLKTFSGTMNMKMILYTLGCPRVGNQAFADLMFDIFPSGTNYRIVHYDDAVPHAIPRAFGFQHAGEEVWYYKAKGDEFKLCENSKGQPENTKCSHSLFLKTGIESHTTYFGHDLGNRCAKRQPSNSLTSSDNIDQGFLTNN